MPLVTVYLYVKYIFFIKMSSYIIKAEFMFSFFTENVVLSSLLFHQVQSILLNKISRYIKGRRYVLPIFF